MEAEDENATRRSNRRRWQPLEYWKGERVIYTEQGAKRAETVGVLTPDLEDNRRKVCVCVCGSAGVCVCVCVNVARRAAMLPGSRCYVPHHHGFGVVNASLGLWACRLSYLLFGLCLVLLRSAKRR